MLLSKWRKNQWGLWCLRSKGEVNSGNFFEKVLRRVPSISSSYVLLHSEAVIDRFLAYIQNCRTRRKEVWSC